MYRATPHLTVTNATEAIEFYKKAFGATELLRLTDPSGKIGHAKLHIGEAEIHLTDELPEWGNLSPEALGGSPVRIGLDVPDVDAFVQRAVGAGARVLIPVADQFYGARSGRLQDPYGHVWIVSTHVKDVPLEEVQRLFYDMMKKPAEKPAEEPPKVNFVREGFRSITPYLIVPGASRFVDFLKNVFGAEEKFRVPTPDGKIMHAEASIAGEMIEFSDGNPEFPPMPAALHLYVGDVDAAYARALDAGAKSIAAPADQNYGERSASVVDPFGNHWYIAKRLGSDPVPADASNLVIYLHPERGGEMIDFMVKGCGAEVAERHDDPDGRIAHAKIRLGNSFIELGEAHGPYQPMPTTIHYYLPDTDAAYHRAIAAGAKSLREPRDEAYGDRSAGVTDPFGNRWFFATHIKDVQF